MTKEVLAYFWGMLGVFGFGPFVTIFAAAILFSEKLTASMSIVLAIVLLSVYFGQKSLVIRK